MVSSIHFLEFVIAAKCGDSLSSLVWKIWLQMIRKRGGRLDLSHDDDPCLEIKHHQTISLSTRRLQCSAYHTAARSSLWWTQEFWKAWLWKGSTSYPSHHHLPSGSAKQRKDKRQGWSKPNAFHICITSYTLVLQVGEVHVGVAGRWGAC